MNLETNKSYVDYIREVNTGTIRSKSVWFNSELRSTKLMTSLKHRFGNDSIDEMCEDAFDVLYINLIKKFEKRYINLGKLVVMYFPCKLQNEFYKNVELGNRRTTFTNFKKGSIWTWADMCEKEPYEKINLEDNNILKLWDKPFILEAVTAYDKDFRKEWVNGYLEYEGNEYGDTSIFYIIGCIDKK